MRVNFRISCAVAATIVSTVVIGSQLGQAGAASTVTGLPVTGYQEEGDSPTLLDNSASALGQVGVDGVNVTADGASVGAPSTDATSQLARAHALGLPAEFLFGNFSASLGDFDENAANLLLTNQGNIDTVVASLADAVTAQGWDGVTIDLESLQARDTEGLTGFVTALKQALPAGKTVSIDVTNGVSQADFAANGDDLASLGQVVDRLVVMAYDEHGTATGPGPVGELSWQQQGLDVILGQVPAAKVDLGVAGYGYSWAPGAAGGVQISDQGARDLVTAAGTTAQFDDASGEWTATLPDGTVLWWSDAQSLGLRRTLAANTGIHGLAVWDLALSDTIQP